MKEIADSLKLVMRYLGTDMTGNRKGRTIIVLALLIAFFINSIFLLVYCWEDINIKMNAVKNITTIYIVGTYTFVYLFCYKDFCLQILVLQDGFFEFPFTISRIRRTMLDNIRQDLVEQNRTLQYTIMMYAIVSNAFPLVGIIFKCFTVKELKDIDVEKLPLNFSFYFPIKFRNMFAFVVVYLYETVLLTIYGMTGYLCYTASLNSMRVIENELKLLRLSVEEVSAFVSSREMTRYTVTRTDSICPINSPDLKSDSSEYLFRLRHYTRYMVAAHQNIYRKGKLVNKGIQAIAFILNSGVSMYLCTSLYFIVKNNNDVMFVAQEAVVCFVVAIVLYLYCVNGEKIITESEKLRTALYEESWLKRPLWYQKALLLMMKQSNKPVEMKPFGMFVLNLRNFLMAINAAYSYYNLANNVTKKK